MTNVRRDRCAGSNWSPPTARPWRALPPMRGTYGSGHTPGGGCRTQRGHTMLDPDTAPLDQLDRQLAALQRHYRTASHLVAERGERPDGIDDDTLAWWVAAHRAVWRRRHELNESGHDRSVDDVELRKDRLRKPAR
jgi:hypothetical protein